MKKNVLFSLVFIAALALALVNCSKPASNLHLPPSQVHFIGNKIQPYAVEVDPAPSHAIQLGVTDVSSEDREITINVTSPTGAAEGTHYTLSTSSSHVISLPAGQTLAEFEVQGIFSAYASGRKDTLIFTFTEPSISPAPFSDTVKLIVRGACFDGDVTEDALNSLLGVYDNSSDDGFGPFGPYTTTIVSITPLTGTTARAVINNVWADGFGNVNFIMDWSDPNNTTIRVENETVVPADAGILNPSFDGLNLVIADHDDPGTTPNNFSVCRNKLYLRYALGVYDPVSGQILGYFPNVGTTIMER